jgi:hypothetical protein
MADIRARAMQFVREFGRYEYVIRNTCPKAVLALFCCAIGHIPHIRTRSHPNSEVNVWRGPSVLALETDRKHETANRPFGGLFPRGNTYVMYCDRCWWSATLVRNFRHARTDFPDSVVRKYGFSGIRST